MRLAVQIGHIPEEGAQYETEHLRIIAPHVLNRLRACEEASVDLYGGVLPWDLRYDAAIFLHCDSGGENSTGFSIGYWEELHPGSSVYARCIYESYRKASGLKFVGWNITPGEHHYYGNRRFITPCKCALIELGFVSNPRERAFLKMNAPALGGAVADGILNYFGKGGEVSQERWSNRQTWVRATLVESHVYIGKLEGQGTVEDAWLTITPFDADAEVTVMAISDEVNKTGTYQVAKNKTQVVTASGFGVTGTVCLRVSSKVPVTVTVDRRGWI